MQPTARCETLKFTGTHRLLAVTHTGAKRLKEDYVHRYNYRLYLEHFTMWCTSTFNQNAMQITHGFRFIGLQCDTVRLALHE